MGKKKPAAKVLEGLEQIRLAGRYIQMKFMSSRLEEMDQGWCDFKELVEKFRREYPDVLTPGQFQKAADNFEYFMVFIEGAINEHKKKTQEQKDFKVQS